MYTAWYLTESKINLFNFFAQDMGFTVCSIIAHPNFSQNSLNLERILMEHEDEIKKAFVLHSFQV